MSVTQLLSENRQHFAPIFGKPLMERVVLPLDLSIKNERLQAIGLESYIAETLKNGEIGIGGYAEHRMLYDSSEHFRASDRCIHLGIDLWAAAETVVCAPLKGKVHSFANNQHTKDYGPTIILEHKIDDLLFYTLYGHLTTDSIKYIQIGQSIKKGEPFCHIGFAHENGGWPPHLHLQIICDLQGKHGDFAGVASKTEAPDYLNNSPNPLLIIV